MKICNETGVFMEKKRTVIKVGTSTLTYENGKINYRRVEQLCKVLSDLQNRGEQVIFVSSGAIAVGMGKAGLDKRPTETKKKQALAAIGQCELMFMYDKLFGEYNHSVAQLLLTRHAVETEQKRQNVINTIDELLRMNIIPVINENDTVTIDELEGNNFGDNDMLSAIVAGLVAAGVHPNPVPYCEFVTTTTHKTLRGPRGGLILCREEFAKQIDKAIFPGTQGGPLMHVIAAKAVCFGEALKPEFKEYGKKIVSNCKALADGLLKRGNKLVSGGTDNHVLLMDLRDTDVTGKELEARLDDCYITVNKNTIPGEPRSPFVTSGVRIGTAAVTTRGLNEEDMDKIAEYITLVLNDYENSKEKVRAGVEEICKKYPLYE